MNNTPQRPNKMFCDFKDFVIKQDHPCIMAQTVFKMDEVEFHSYPNITSAETTKNLLKDLEEYVQAYDFESNEFLTFIAGFEGQRDYSEEEFEALLWQQLQMLHEADHYEWDADVNDDSSSDEFSFSLIGKAFYVVGMHPNSSRIARQSPFPTIVFNLHWQFEKLRQMGSYETVRDRIRERDEELQGSMNPMLSDFGKGSEAKQYSGKKVDDNWKCPFHK